MVTTGRYSKHEDTKPEEPFLNDIKSDIKLIDASYLKTIGNDIKKKIINELLNSI
tara:strand:+ start:31622 stop:31786 length:165 start_codon:yes stop_codon:yes gene_type:complete